ncbi:unnamed protein product [Dibothriocephalus latus]|uniref:Uncharacterized protein n=1 Tax=Dibothriocephalus latus TaxID=60516 RepID=A0A3P7L9D0_DIBLA|nr:unnamed protein product [Dibothriocephalus latus]
MMQSQEKLDSQTLLEASAMFFRVAGENIRLPKFQSFQKIAQHIFKAVVSSPEIDDDWKTFMCYILVNMLLASNQKKEANDLLEQLSLGLSKSCPYLFTKLIAKANAAGLSFAERLVVGSLIPMNKIGDLSDNNQPNISNMPQKKPTTKLTDQQLDAEVHLLYKALTLGDMRNADEETGSLLSTEIRRNQLKTEKRVLTEQEEKQQIAFLKIARLLSEEARSKLLLDLGYITLKYGFFDVTSGCIDALEKYYREKNVKVCKKFRW